MKIFIPTASTMDIYMVRAAQEMGHVVYQLCQQDKWRIDSIREACKADHFFTMPSRFEANVDRDEYKQMHREMMAKIVEEHDIDVLLPTSSLDFSMDDIAAINLKYGLPGITPEHAVMFRDKANYLPMLLAAGVKVPKIYEIVEPEGIPREYDLPYPVIAKPGYGSGGFGVYVVNDADKLNWLFSASDNPTGFSDRALFNQDRNASGEPFCYVHNGFGGRYLIQEYMTGQCVSLVGTSLNGKLYLDLAYDINVTEAPYCSEISFGYPSTQQRALEAAEELTASLESALSFPNGAWMADTIYKDGYLYLIDLSCRASSSGTKMMHHISTDRSEYPKNVMRTMMGMDREVSGHSVRAAVYSYIPFPKGQLTDVEYPYWYDSRIVEINKRIESKGGATEMRNDVQVVDRGHIAAEAESREEAERLVSRFLKSIKYKIQ
jgi:hypothetical protein